MQTIELELSYEHHYHPILNLNSELLGNKAIYYFCDIGPVSLRVPKHYRLPKIMKSTHNIYQPATIQSILNRIHISSLIYEVRQTTIAINYFRKDTIVRQRNQTNVSHHPLADLF
jgi:hypothetical protein